MVLTEEGKKLIKKKRVELFGSQDAVTWELGIPQINVSRWESGRMSPRYYPLRSYLIRLGLHPGFLSNKKYVLGTKHVGFKIKKIKREKMSKELAYVLGVVGPGDGWINSEYAIGLNATDKDFVDYFQFSLEKVFGLSCSRYKRKGARTKIGNLAKEQFIVVLSSKSAVQSLKKFKVPFKEKIWRIPQKIKNSTNGHKGAYLKGVFDSQACIFNKRVNRFIAVKIINPAGMREIQSLLEDFNIQSSIHNDKVKLQITGKKNLELYRKFIDFTINRKKEKLKKAILSYKQEHTPREEIRNLLPKMARLKHKGVSFRKIAKELNLNKTTVINTLRRAGY